MHYAHFAACVRACVQLNETIIKIAIPMCCITKQHWELSFAIYRFWKEFKKFQQCDFPKIIIKILSLCAIDTLEISDNAINGASIGAGLKHR